MASHDLEALIARLKTHDTPTICNAIEVAHGRRGFDCFTHRTILWSGPPDLRVVGFARTARIAGRKPPQEPPEDIRAHRRDYFRSMAAGPRPGVALIEDMDGDTPSRQVVAGTPEHIWPHGSGIVTLGIEPDCIGNDRRSVATAAISFRTLQVGPVRQDDWPTPRIPLTDSD